MYGIKFLFFLHKAVRKIKSDQISFKQKYYILRYFLLYNPNEGYSKDTRQLGVTRNPEM